MEEGAGKERKRGDRGECVTFGHGTRVTFGHGTHLLVPYDLLLILFVHKTNLET